MGGSAALASVYTAHDLSLIAAWPSSTVSYTIGKWAAAVLTVDSLFLIAASPSAGSHGVAPWEEPERGALHRRCPAAGRPLAAIRRRDRHLGAAEHGAPPAHPAAEALPRFCVRRVPPRSCMQLASPCHHLLGAPMPVMCIQAASACDEAHLFDFVQVLNDQAYLLFYSKAR
jgi:hypothetical protein